MLLQEQIEEQRKQIHTDGYLMSIGEWISLYEKDEIDIHPEFQRYFRWSHTQKSRLIESILLGIPVPQVFVAQRKDGVWEVVDGLQRLSTIYQFVGILKDEEGNLEPPLVLDGTEYLSSLKGKKWDDENDPENSLMPAQRLLIKRSKIGVSIILSDSDENSKYALFERLNTGGLALSLQEVRNNTLISLNSSLYQWVREMSNDPNFKAVTNLNEKQIREQFDMSLVVRYLVFRKWDKNDKMKPYTEEKYITRKMSEFARQNNLDLEEETAAFRTTFSLLNEQVGPDCFHSYSLKTGKFDNIFESKIYDCVAPGLGYHYPAIESQSPSDLHDKIVVLWNELSAISGIRDFPLFLIRTDQLIPIGRKVFAP